MGGGSPEGPPTAGDRRWELVRLGAIFLRLGLISFGGPAAHIALMRDEFVRRRGWLDDAEYVDLIGAANLIPGPTSTEVAMHVGHRRAGWPGLVVAGLAFLLPAVLIVGVLAAIYVAQGSRPEVEAVLIGVAPVVVAIVAFAGASIGRTALRSPTSIALAVATVGLAALGAPEVVVLLGAGVVALVAWWVRAPATSAAGGLFLLGTAGSHGPAGSSGAAAHGAAGLWAAAAAVTVAPAAIFLEFLKIGAVLFGSGYVLVALLRSELVVGLGWITENQLIDAVAVGQATPGPLFSTGTFIGYLVAGPIGAVAATIGIFLPAFVAVAVSIPILGRLRASGRARAFLDGVNAAAVGLLALVAAQLAIGTLSDPIGMVTAIAAFLLLLRGLGTGWLIAAGAVIGLGRLVLVPG